MTVLRLQLPTSLYDQLLTASEREGITLDQFIALSMAEKMATIDTANYLQERAKRGSREKLLAVLAKAPDVAPEEADRLPV